MKIFKSKWTKATPGNSNENCTHQEMANQALNKISPTEALPNNHYALQATE